MAANTNGKSRDHLIKLYQDLIKECSVKALHLHPFLAFNTRRHCFKNNADRLIEHGDMQTKRNQLYDLDIMSIGKLYYI